MISNDDILSTLTGLVKPDYDVHVCEAWYCTRSILRAIGSDRVKFEDYPEVKVVRVGLKHGMLELHPVDDTHVAILCYCCFGKEGEEKKGIYTLSELTQGIKSFKEHTCPPWPG